MFLILMSMLRKSNSIRINMTPLLIISEKLYKILDFDKPKVRYLCIDLHRSIYPVNVFHEGEWSFDSNLENEKISKNLSLAAYALFKFLLYSNYIYSIEQIEIYCNHNEGKIEEQLKYMLGRYKQQNELPIYDVKAYYYLPNLEILDIKTCIKYEKHNSIEYFTNRDMLTDSDFFTKIQSKSVDKYILSSEREMFNYTFDVIGKVTALLSKLYNLPPKIYLGEFIDKTFHKVEFLSFGGIIFDCSITVFRTKSLDKDSKDLICAPKVNQFDLALQVPLNSFALGKTLPIGTVVRLIVYSKMLEGMITSDTCLLNISITSNTITVFCTNIDQKIINLTVLGRLWPGMILVLEDFCCCTDTGIQILLELVCNGDGTTKGCKLMFSKIVFSKLRETCYANNELKYFEPFLKSLNKLYPIEFSNSDIERIEDLFNQDNIKYRIIERNKSRINAELCKYFSYINCDSRKTKIVKTEKGDLVEFCSSNKANKILDGLKLKDYEFYKSKIGLSRELYDKLHEIYISQGQFNYFDQRDEGFIVDPEGSVIGEGVVAVVAVVPGEVDCIRQINVHAHGQIKELECNSKSDLIRARFINANGCIEQKYFSKKTENTNGYVVLKYADGTIEKGEMYEHKWNGYKETCLANNEVYKGMIYEDKAFGTHRHILDDGCDDEFKISDSMWW